MRARSAVFFGRSAISYGLLGLVLTACGSAGAPSEADPRPDLTPDTPPDVSDDPGPGPACTGATLDPTSQSFIVTDPAILSAFTLDRVLKQLISLSGPADLTPEALLQRMFDAENDAAHAVFPDVYHCDDPTNPAFKNGPAVSCPRAEGQLASSEGLFVEGHKDYFAPVALVNRFDLMNQGLEACGEQRIVFAKWSGRTDPNDRVFLIFEGALGNPLPGTLTGCRDVAQAWVDVGKAGSTADAKALLEKLYFTGLPGFLPVIHPDHFGALSTQDASYGSARGQIRISQRMQEPWEMREYRFVQETLSEGSAPRFLFEPSTVKNNPIAALFDTNVQSDRAISLRNEFLFKTTWSLAQASEWKNLRMQVSNQYNAGESALSGAASVDYAAKATGIAGSDFKSAIEEQMALAGFGENCAESDPLTAESVLHRAAVLTCAGCHAPEKFVGAERKLGCGLTFPSTLGGVHISEKGELSPALVDVFLPRRAEILSTYLSSCDDSLKYNNLELGGIGGGGLK